MHSVIGADQVLDSRVSRSGTLAKDQKAVQRRGPGRVVLGSKPQLATTEKLVRWAGEQAAACDCQIARELGSTREVALSVRYSAWMTSIFQSPRPSWLGR